MKRMLLLALCLMLLLPGCGSKEAAGAPKFYYLRQEDTIRSEDGFMACERMHSIDPKSDLHYLLALYFAGPTDKDLASPFPRNSGISTITREGDTLTLGMNDAYSTLSGFSFVRAGACLSVTVFGLTDAATVVIAAADTDDSKTRTIQFHRDSLLLLDPLTPTE